MKPTKGTNNPQTGQEYLHPAFATASIARVSGSASLFQSSVKHQHFIEMNIQRACVHRHRNQDRVHTNTNPIISIAMSEAQWATLISSINMGNGVPCTLLRAPAEDTPINTCPPIESFSVKAAFREEVKQFTSELVEDGRQALKKLDRVLAGGTVRKGDLKEIRDLIVRAFNNIGSNAAFIHAQFDEAMEDAVQQGKAEIDGYLADKLAKMGLQGLAHVAAAENNLLSDDSDDDESTNILDTE